MVVAAERGEDPTTRAHISGRVVPHPPVPSSVLDIEGVAERLVEPDPGVEVEVANWL